MRDLCDRLGASALISVILLAPVAARAQDAASTVEKCGRSFGTITVVDPRSGIGALQRYGLGSPSALLRMMIQQSGCFDVVERGVAMQNMQQERALVQSGAARDDSNVGQGQIQVADFVMTPDVQIPTSDTGGAGGGIGGLLGGLGRVGAVVGGLAGGVKFKEATTSLLIADVRSSLQVASAEGKASRTDFSVGGWGIGGGGAGALGAYTSSPEGKVVAASLLDNYNKIVIGIRDKPQLIKPGTAEAIANAQASTRAEAPQRPGEMLTPKIANVKVYAEPSRDSTVVGAPQRGDEMVATGELKNGFVRVDAANFSGWVQRTLVGPLAGGAAVQASAPAPIASMPPVALAAPSMRYGLFVGSLEGADRGNFRVTIDDEGNVSGDGSMTRYGAFGLMGNYDAGKGQLVMTGGSSGGTVLFVGRLDPSQGLIVGSWNVGQNAMTAPVSGVGGSFRARRQQ